MCRGVGFQDASLPPHGLLGCPNSYQGYLSAVSFYPKNRPGITPLEPEFSSESDQGFTHFGRVFIRIENFGGQAFGLIFGGPAFISEIIFFI